MLGSNRMVEAPKGKKLRHSS